MKTLKNLKEVKSFVGSELGVSKWHQISQSQISKFGKVTGDEQWIHTAPVRAKLLSPFKSTIAHGFLVLSLLPKFLEETYACLLYTSPSPRDISGSRMPSSA